MNQTSRLHDETILENGMTVPTLAGSCQRVYCLCTRGMTSTKYDQELLSDLVMDRGWLNVASVIVSFYAASDEENQVLTVNQLADQIRRAYSRGLDGCDPAAPFENLGARERLSWEMVARHAAGVVGADKAELDRLEAAEYRWGDHLLDHARKRGVNLDKVH